MKVRDVMTWNVVSISSDTHIMEAKKIMEAHKLRRLPVIDKGKVVGVVTKDRIDRTSPSPATSLSVWEINYLLAKMTVKDIMAKEVVTVPPNMSAESAVALAQSKGVGALFVEEGHNLIGVVTTNDFFYKILNPVLGIGKPGTRLTIGNCSTAKRIKEVMEVIEKHGVELLAIHNWPALEGEEPQLIVHLNTEDTSQITKDLENIACSIELRER